MPGKLRGNTQTDNVNVGHRNSPVYQWRLQTRPLLWSEPMLVQVSNFVPPFHTQSSVGTIGTLDTALNWSRPSTIHSNKRGLCAGEVT